MIKQNISWRLPLSSLVIIFVVALVGIAATQALYRDVEKSNQGEFVVGTLDLDVAANQGEATDHFVVENLGEPNTLAGSKTWVIRNIGSLPGNLLMRLENLKNQELGCNEPEALEDTSCDNPGDQEGELGQYLMIKVFTIKNAKEQLIAETNLAQQAALGQLWDENTGGGLLVPPGSQLLVRIDWQLGYEQFVNQIQGDSVMFDIVFELVQLGRSNNDKISE